LNSLFRSSLSMMGKASEIVCHRCFDQLFGLVTLIKWRIHASIAGRRRIKGSSHNHNQIRAIHEQKKSRFRSSCIKKVLSIKGSESALILLKVPN